MFPNLLEPVRFKHLGNIGMNDLMKTINVTINKYDTIIKMYKNWSDTVIDVEFGEETQM